MPHTYMRAEPARIGTNACLVLPSELWIFSMP
jgi:hypothetical protein